MNIDQLKLDVVGKWASIFERLGISVGDGHHQFCPICSPGDPESDRFRFDDKEGSGSWICGQCGAGDGLALVQKVLGINFLEACEAVSDIVGHVKAKKYQPEKVMTKEKFREIFKSANKISHMDIVTLYLRNRGLKIDTLPKNLWSTTKCWEPETKKNQIAMLSVFQNKDGKAITVHRTYLDNLSHKLKIDNPKKMLPPLEPMNGGAVRLYDPDKSLPLGITEGIETAIAVYESIGFPTWSALSSTLLQAWEPPPGVESVIVFADNDLNFTGQKAAYALANKLVIKNKVKVDVQIPGIPGTDFLDEIMG